MNRVQCDVMDLQQGAPGILTYYKPSLSIKHFSRHDDVTIHTVPCLSALLDSPPNPGSSSHLDLVPSWTRGNGRYELKKSI